LVASTALDGGLGDDLDDSAADLQRRERLVYVRNRERDARVALEVARLLPVNAGADHDVVVVAVDPDGRHGEPSFMRLQREQSSVEDALRAFGRGTPMVASMLVMLIITARD
jgi:hypothetical protein